MRVPIGAVACKFCRQILPIRGRCRLLGGCFWQRSLSCFWRRSLSCRRLRGRFHFGIYNGEICHAFRLF